MRPGRGHQQRPPRQAVHSSRAARRGGSPGTGAANRPGPGAADQDVRAGGNQPPGRRDPPQDEAAEQPGDKPQAHRRRHRRKRAAPVRKIAGGSLLPAHRREAGIMIATIKSEWRKNRFRPAFLVGTGLVAAITVLFYSVAWYQATHFTTVESAVSIVSLFPSNFVNNAMAAGFPLGAAMAIVLVAL